jgi:hypothetical protein
MSVSLSISQPVSSPFSTIERMTHSLSGACSKRITNQVTDHEAAKQRIIDRLPVRDEDEWYTPEDIAPLLGVKVRQVRYYCHAIWKNHDPKSQWRLRRAEAERLIRKAYFSGSKIPRV